MATIESVAEGLQILMKYSTGHCVNAQHDILFAGPDKAGVVSPEDRARLEELGWHISSESGGWARFT